MSSGNPFSAIDNIAFLSLPKRASIILLAIVIAMISSIWVKTVGFGDFVTLMISAILFFAAYGIVLIIRKEPLVWEISQQLLQKMKSRAKQ